MKNVGVENLKTERYFFEEYNIYVDVFREKKKYAYLCRFVYNGKEYSFETKCNLGKVKGIDWLHEVVKMDTSEMIEQIILDELAEKLL